MTNSKIERWEPTDLIPPQLYLNDLHDNHDGLKISLIMADSDKVLLIAFKSHILYQYTDETSALKRLNEDEILSTQWPLFISDNSGLINLTIEGSHGIVEKNSLIHYIITCGEGIIDVLSNKPPEVSWL